MTLAGLPKDQRMMAGLTARVIQIVLAVPVGWLADVWGCLLRIVWQAHQPVIWHQNPKAKASAQLPSLQQQCSCLQPSRCLRGCRPGI